MVRVSNLEESLEFYCNHLGLVILKKMDNAAGRYTLVFLGTSKNSEDMVELTYNWDPEVYTEGRNFGHLAFQVEDIYAMCQQLIDAGITLNRPPRDGYMAFVRSPDNISIEILQAGEPLTVQEPWASMPNQGHW
jgi:lactoylglutathione lyase